MDARAPGRLLALGQVSRPHGVRGEVRVRPFHREGTALGEAEALWIWLPEVPEEAQRLAVLGCRRAGDAWLIRFAGVEDRETAAELRGVHVGLPREALPPLGDEEIYVADLEGLDARDPTGRFLGHIEAVLPYPSVVAVRLRQPDGAAREVPLVAPWYVEARLEQGLLVLDDVAAFPVVPEGRRRR